MTRKPKPLPEKIIKSKYESDYHFMKRINGMVAQSMAEANLEEHFDVDLGEKIIDNDNKMDLIDPKKLERKREKNKMNSLRRKANKLKKQRKLIKQLNNCEDISLKDNVNFGEVVHCPPNFEFKNKKCNK